MQSFIPEIPLAIVGLSCRLPGGETLEEFWQLLIEGRSELGELPPDRLDKALYYHPEKGHRTKSYASIGGITKNSPFDAAKNPLPPELIGKSHKVHLRLFEVAADACRRAGLDPYGLEGRNVGVYIGHTPPSALAGKLVHARQIELTAQYLREVPGFAELPQSEQEAIISEVIAEVRSEFPPGDERIKLQGNAYHGAALISQGFKLNGPAMSFDAACASSLRALGHAVRALQLGQIEMAIVGGASYCHGDTLVLFSQAQSVSPNTGSRPFDENADGLVAAGGYVAVVIKTLEQALADNDNIEAVIRSVAVSSDGKGKSLWAPLAKGQSAAIQRAYHSDLSLSDLQYIEMHATSTQVGDATEMGALANVMEGQLPPGRKIAVGSVKANIGHTLETAGLASLCKVVLALKHKVVPPQINITKLNESIPWDQIPFFVPTSPLPLVNVAPDVPVRAAVNTFGIGGLNVHVVLDEYIPEASRKVVADIQRKRAAAAQQNDEPIAVIGMGTVMPGALTIEALWDSITSGADLKSDTPPTRWNKELGSTPDSSTDPWKVPTARGGYITGFEYDWKKHKVPPKQIQSADPLQFMLLDAADQALKHAGYHEREFNRQRTGVIVGTIFGGEFTDQLQAGLRLPETQALIAKFLTRRGIPDGQIEEVCARYEDVLLKHLPALIDETGSFTASTLASRITKTFDLMGGAVAVDSGDASSFAALSASIDHLRAGDCDMMLCAAGHRSMGLAGYLAMQTAGLLSETNEPAGPFDAEANGCVPAEGVGVVILKRLSDARRDGDVIHAVIRGIGAARHENVQESLKSAIRSSLENAGVNPDEVSVIEAASSGMPRTDGPEWRAVNEVYKTGTRPDLLRMSALSAQLGNAGGAAGMLAMLKAIEELNRAAIPGYASPRRAAAYVQETAGNLQLATATVPIRIANAAGHGIAGVNSISQYSVAYHMLIEGGAAVPNAIVPAAVTGSRGDKPASAGLAASPWRIVRLAAPTIAQLAETAAAANGEQLFAEAEHIEFQVSDRCRLAIVAESGADLAAKLQLAAKQVGRPEARGLLGEKGIFYGTPDGVRPRVAFLFPGQGSQYDGMLQQLVDEFEPAARARQAIDSIFRKLNMPLFADIAWGGGHPLPSDVWQTQLSLIAADTIVLAAVTALGMRPDRVGGHSFGELCALVASGSWTFEEAVRATIARCRSIDACTRANGKLVSTSAPAHVLEQLCVEAGNGATVSHRNAPEQTVAGGPDEAVDRLSELVQSRGYKAKVLDVPAAFHTPLLEEVKEPFGAALKDIRLEPPRLPMLSSVTNRYVAEPDEIRENLVVQMTQPVGYVELVKRLADEGVTVFVEVGPRQVLTGLHKQILDGRDVAIVGCDHNKRPGMQQLLFAKACLEAAGAIDLQPADALLPLEATPTTAIAAVQETEAAATTAEKTQLQPAVPTGPATADEHAALNILKLRGTPYEMGLQQGRAQMQEIRAVLRRYADLAGTKWEKLFDLDQACQQPEMYFGPDELEELRGVAKGADVTLSAIVAHNLRLYFDAETGGVHFAVSAQQNPAEGLLHAANEDLSKAIRISDCLARNIQVREPSGLLPYVTFCVAGQVGSLNGINGAGLAVSTATLVDVPHEEIKREGHLHTVLVKRILERAGDVDAAVEIIRQSRIAGTWGLCISHASSDQVCYVESDTINLRTVPHAPAVLAANHRLLLQLKQAVPPHSELRLNRLKEILGGSRPTNITVAQAQKALRDHFDPAKGKESDFPTINTVRRVQNQISIVMQPAQGNIWVTGGPMTNGHQNEFTLLRLNDLLPGFPLPRKNGAQAVKPESAAATAPVSIQPSSLDAPAVSAAALSASYRAAKSLADHRVCRRFVMRMLPQERSAPNVEPLLNGAAIVIGDNAVGLALQQRLLDAGVPVILVPGTADIDATIEAIEGFARQQAIPHLFITTPFDAEAITSLETVAWQSRRQQGAMLPYLVAQAWFQHVVEGGLLGKASVYAVTNMGGSFGFDGRLTNVESGALTGLVKGIALEVKLSHQNPPLRARIVDFEASASPESIVATVFDELAVADEEVEVGYFQGKRHVARPVAQDVSVLPSQSLSAERPFVITGGARGVTAVVARELGRRFHMPLHLIGSSPLSEIPESYLAMSEDELKEVKAAMMKEAIASGQKPMDVWNRFEKSLEAARTLKSFRDAGLSATYHACDIGSREAVAAVLDAIRAQHGPIGGVIHGAGFERATRFEKKQRELVDRTISAKVDGAANLMELTKDDPVQVFAGFGSVSGRFGGVGQTDYCVANEMLSKLIDWYREQRPGVGASVFHWHAWDDVGMAVRPESKHIAKLHNIKFMPSQEGADHLLAELCCGLPEGEIAITELHFCEARYGSPAGETPELVAARPSSRETSATSLPLVDSLQEFIPGQKLITQIQFDPVRDIFLRQHKFKDRPMLPVVISLEAISEAAALLAGGADRISGLRDIQLHNGLRFLNDEPIMARVHAEATADGIHCRLTSDLVNRQGKILKADREFVTCTVDREPADLQQYSLPTLPGDWLDCWYSEENIVIWHGPVFRCLRQITVDGHDCWGRMISPRLDDLNGDRSGNQWLTPPAVLDACFFAGGAFLWFLFKGVVAIPAGIDRFIFGRQPEPGEELIVHIRYCGRNGDKGIFDFNLFGEDGKLILRVEGFNNVIVTEAPAHAT